jgi:hypothetical protein
MWHHAVLVRTDVSEERVVFIFRVENPQSAATCSRWILALGFFYLEDEGDTFLLNVGSHKNYTAPHPRKRHSSIVLLFAMVSFNISRFLG